ncbi:MAG: EamA family transporter [Glaciimonas sp.]|nr:EamA family transporter [Glaciimonas sp.]
MLYGGGLAISSTLFSGQELSVEWSIRHISSLLYLAIFGSAIASVGYLKLLGRIGSGQAAFTTLLFPLAALISSASLEHYQWNKYLIVGIVLILFSNAVMLRR